MQIGLIERLQQALSYPENEAFWGRVGSREDNFVPADYITYLLNQAISGFIELIKEKRGEN